MAHVQWFQLEHAFALVHAVIGDQVGLRVVDLTVEKHEMRELLEVWAPRMDQIQEAHSCDRIAWEVQGA